MLTYVAADINRYHEYRDRANQPMPRQAGIDRHGDLNRARSHVNAPGGFASAAVSRIVQGAKRVYPRRETSMSDRRRNLDDQQRGRSAGGSVIRTHLVE